MHQNISYHLQQSKSMQNSIFILASVYQTDLLRNPLLWKLNVPNMTPIDFLEYSACFKNNVLHRPPGEVWRGPSGWKLWIQTETLSLWFSLEELICLFFLILFFFVTHTGAVFTQRSITNEIILISLLFSSIQAIRLYSANGEFSFQLLTLSDPMLLNVQKRSQATHTHTHTHTHHTHMLVFMVYGGLSIGVMVP